MSIWMSRSDFNGKDCALKKSWPPFTGYITSARQYVG